MQTLAIIGTGIAGMGCAHQLQNKYDLSIYEQNDYVGGHTNTIAVGEGDRKVVMDTGFMVFNFKTYPNLCQLFDEIKAPIKKTDMSFSVQYKPDDLEYCGSGFSGLFAQKKNLFNIPYINMLRQIARFNSLSLKILDDPRYVDYSLEKFIKEFRFSDAMLWKYLIPMSSAVWSTPMEKMLDFPIITLIRFFKNHGFLGLHTQHQWYTLENGSESYKTKLIAPFKEKIHVNMPVSKISRNSQKVLVEFKDGSKKEFDKVILACHGDQALRVLDKPTADEQRLLSPFKYEKNYATVHIDESVMPKNKKVWSSWNYRIENRSGKLLPTTIYWMNKLQGVSDRKNYFVSINAYPGSIAENKTIKRIEYEHPLFDLAAIKAQDELPILNKKGPIYFCGSYFKYGFHEDAYKSAVDLCSLL